MLQKKEWVYRELLDSYFEKHRTDFTQLELSRKFSISLSTVNNAISPLRSMGAIDVKARKFSLVDAKKMLFYWATVRSPEKDIVYSTRYEAPVQEIEKLMPSSSSFTAFSAYRLIYREAPADYSGVYLYSREIDEIKARFPPQKGPANIFVLEAGPFIRKNAVSPSQIFADLWNIRSWYAKEFLDALERRLF